MHLPNIRDRWRLLTDDDLRIAGNNPDVLAVCIVARYGIAKEWADREVAEWLADMAPLLRPARAGHD